MKALKAIVPMALGLIFSVLQQVNVEIPDDFKVSVMGLASAILVWLVPNKG